jgi:hypothetical protein
VIEGSLVSSSVYRARWCCNGGGINRGLWGRRQGGDVAPKATTGISLANTTKGPKTSLSSSTAAHLHLHPSRLILVLASSPGPMPVPRVSYKLKCGHLDQVCKRLVNDPGPERKRKLDDEAQNENKKRQTGTANTTTEANMIPRVEWTKPGTDCHL